MTLNKHEKKYKKVYWTNESIGHLNKQDAILDNLVMEQW